MEREREREMYVCRSVCIHMCRYVSMYVCMCESFFCIRAHEERYFSPVEQLYPCSIKIYWLQYRLYCNVLCPSDICESFEIKTNLPT